MNNKMKILITTLIIFLFFSASLFTYYNVNEKKEIEDENLMKSISWEEYMLNKPQEILKIYNTSTKEYDKYQLSKVNFDEVTSTSKEVVKEVRKYSNIKLDKKDFPDILEYDRNTQLKLSNIIIEPTFIEEKQWHDEIESQIKIYNNLENADLINIPKEIYENNESWFLLTDTAKFDILGGKYICTASYHRIKRVVEEKKRIDNYIVKVIYSGKRISNIGNVMLTYKPISRRTIREISRQISFKLLVIPIILLISMISIILIYKSLLINNKRR